jgi:GAF domain-containing protein
VLQQLVSAALQADAGATSLPAQTFAAMVVAALFGPAERRIGRVVEAVFNRRMRWRLQQLQRLSREISFIDDPARLKRALVERVAEVLAVESVALHWRDAVGREYRLVQESGLNGVQRAVRFRKSDGLAVWLAMDRVPLELASLQRDARYRRLDAGEKRLLAALGASLCVPLAAGGQLAGFLTLGSRRDRDLYSSEEKEALLAVGGLAAVALRQAEMEQRLRELEREHRGGPGAIRRLPSPPWSTGRSPV